LKSPFPVSKAPNASGGTVRNNDSKSTSDQSFQDDQQQDSQQTNNKSDRSIASSGATDLISK